MTATIQVDVISERDNIKKIIFRGSILYIIWDDDTASMYQYTHVKNLGIKEIKSKLNDINIS